MSYLNVRKGLLIKGDDIRFDNILTNSDIFAIGETCLTNHDEVYYNGFKSIFANVRNGQGTAVYVKNDLECDSSKYSDEKIYASIN